MRRFRHMVLAATCLSLGALLASTPGAGAHTARHVTAGPRYGGTLRVAYTGNFTSFDAAQAYTDDWYVMNGTLYDGLYRFDRYGKPQLDLAAQPPTISPDRKTWTFHLRKGVLFSNGMELTANDVKYSITRTLDPHLKPAASWGQPYDEPLFVGAHDFVTGKATSVSGIQVLDRYTVRFRLTQPVAILPDLLASSFNMIVPQAVASKEGGDYFGSHPVGSGPFMLQSWQKGVRAIFVRNPHYFRKGKPYVDKVIAYSSMASSLIALKIEKGDLDGFGRATELSAPDLQLARSNPTYARYLVNAPSTTAIWLDLNVHVAPLTDRRIRQAIALAINRRRLVQALGGTAVAANQIYVPLDPQYDPTLDAHPRYPYNPHKAAALVKASGYHGQPITLYYATNYPFEVSMATALQQMLQQVGLTVTLRGAMLSSIISQVAALTGSQMSFASWSIDFPDAYDVYSGTMACAVNGAGQASAAHYCDRRADDLVTRAEGLPLGPERDALLRQAQVRILDSAAQIPLIFVKTIDMVSPKVRGFYYNPVFAWEFQDYWLQQ